MSLGFYELTLLTLWGRVTSISVGKQTIIGSDNGLSPGQRQAIIWTNAGIYIIIAKNIRYLLWNRGAWRFFHDTYLTIEVQGIWCTHHLHDSCPLTDVNQHFTALGCRYYFKIWWPNVTSSTHGPAASYCDVTMIHCSHGYLWTHDVEVEESSRDSWFNIFVYFPRHFRTPVFQHGASLVLLIGPLRTNFIHENAFENVVCEMAFILSRPQCVNLDLFRREE